jgi:hypothetical protein
MTRPSALLSIAALGIFCNVVGWFGGCIGWVITSGATWAYFFYVFMCAARGAPLDVPDFSSISDVTDPLFRGLVSSTYVWGPTVFYVLVVKQWVPGDPLEEVTSDPVFFLILGWCLFYGPMAFIVAATNASFGNLLNPIALVGSVFKLGADYFIALAVVAVSLIIHAVLSMIGGALIGTGLPILSGAIPEMISLIMPFFMSHALGQLLYVHGDKLGYGVDDDYYEPVLAGARPQGRLPTKARGSAPAKVGTGSAEQVLEAAQASREANVADSAGAAAEAGDPLRVVAEAVAARDTAGALNAYRGLKSLALSRLAPEQHLFVGRAAVGGGELELAAKAFETAADVAPNAPTAPQALVLLARLCAERLQDAARAQSVYRYIVHRYPNTDASRFAAQRLPPEA